MAVSVVRLGSPRGENEGLRIGTVRRPPRGVRKADYSRKNIYDLWFPNLAPSEQLLKESMPSDERTWKQFRRRFLVEMSAPEPRRTIELLAALSQQTDFSVGCYCEDETRCHRSLLRDLLSKAGASIR